MVTVLYRPEFLEHVPGHHAERPARPLSILEHIDAAGLRERLTWAQPRAATPGELLAVHSRPYLALVEGACGRSMPLDPDTRTCPASWDAARYAAGGAIEAARLALAGEPAFSLARPPGHHATPTRPMGFCLFNNVAVAAEWALAEGGARRVAILDFDVHHGNGTQDAFYERSDVLYVSTHQAPLYPGTGDLEETGVGAGAGYTVNLPVPAFTGDGEMRTLLDEVVRPILREYDPDLLLLSAGFDAHHRDPLASLRMTADGFHAMVRTLVRDHPRVAGVLEGGYDLQGLGRSCASTLGALLGRDVAWPDEAAPRAPAYPGLSTAPYREVHGERWKL